MAHTISNSDDVIDSRDVIAWIEELESERENLVDAWAAYVQLANQESAVAPDFTLEEWDDSEDGADLKALKALADEASGSPDWPHGETLIRDSYFIDYAQELAEDIGAIGKELPWPTCHIDWEAAANALKQDYMSVDYDGVEYWIRG